MKKITISLTTTQERIIYGIINFVLASFCFISIITKFTQIDFFEFVGYLISGLLSSFLFIIITINLISRGKYLN